jgi:hypothetical protein
VGVVVGVVGVVALACEVSLMEDEVVVVTVGNEAQNVVAVVVVVGIEAQNVVVVVVVVVVGQKGCRQKVVAVVVVEGYLVGDVVVVEQKGGRQKVVAVVVVEGYLFSSHLFDCFPLTWTQLLPCCCLPPLMLPCCCLPPLMLPCCCQLLSHCSQYCKETEKKRIFKL